MYFTSQEYDSEMESTVRNPHFARLIFGLSNKQIQLQAEIVDNGHLTFGRSSSIAQGIEVFKTNETLEWNRFSLDGRNILASKQNPTYQGFCSDKISGTGGKTNNFDENPKLFIGFKSPIEIKGISIQFDTTKNDFVTTTKIKTFDENELLVDEFIGKVQLSDYPMLILNKQFKPFVKMEIEFLETFPSKRRVRVFSIVFGITKIIDDDILKELNLQNDMDLVATNLPVQTMDFTLIDTENIYDIENPNSIHNYLDNGQPVTLLLGYELGSGNIEWINMCKTFTTGTISANGTPDMTEISVETESILTQLDILFDESLAKPKTLYELAIDLVNFAGYSKDILDLDPILKEYKTSNIFPKISVREGLQLIANAGLCVIGISRGGQIYIRRESLVTSETNFEFNFEKIIDYPTSSKIPILKTLTSSYTKQVVEDEKELAKLTIDNAEYKDFIIELETTSKNYIQYPDTVDVIDTVDFYCNSIKLTAKGSGEILVFGTPVKNNQIKQFYDSNLDGTNLEVHNPLIDNREWCIEYMAYIINSYIRRSSYDFSHRGYPKIDLMDEVGVQNNFGEIKQGIVVENSINYDGALEGTCKIISNERGLNLGRTR